MIALRKEGLNILQIMDKVKLSRSTVEVYLRKAGFDTGFLCPYDTSKVAELLAQGKAMYQVAEELKLPRVFLFKYIQRNGLSYTKISDRYTDEEKKAIASFIEKNQKETYDNRLTNDELSAKFNYPLHQIKSIKDKFGLKLSDSQYYKYSVEDLKASCALAKLTFISCDGPIATSKWFTFRCLCGRESEALVGSVLNDTVTSCGCRKSKPQIEIEDYFRGLGMIVEVEDHTLLKRKKQRGNSPEIDVYIPAKKLAVEYTGLRWHLSKDKGPSYHYQKYKELEEQGIQLLTIFEDEWLEKPDIVKSILAAKVGVSKHIHARKCEVSTDREVILSFIKKNHIQGTIGQEYVGLTLDGEMVAGMAFQKAHRLSKDGYELSRYCNKAGTTVVGGFSRLMSVFIKSHNPKEIVSLSDNRWSTGTVYIKNGFRLLRESRPSYYYVQGKRRLTKYNFKKSELKKKGWLLDGESEGQCMARKGIHQIHDCGKKTWIWTPNVT